MWPHKALFYLDELLFNRDHDCPQHSFDTIGNMIQMWTNNKHLKTVSCMAISFEQLLTFLDVFYHETEYTQSHLIVWLPVLIAANRLPLTRTTCNHTGCGICMAMWPFNKVSGGHMTSCTWQVPGAFMMTYERPWISRFSAAAHACLRSCFSCVACSFVIYRFQWHLKNSISEAISDYDGKELVGLNK